MSVIILTRRREMTVKELRDKLCRYSDDAIIQVMPHYNAYDLQLEDIKSISLRYNRVIIYPRWDKYQCSDCTRQKYIDENNVHKILSNVTEADYNFLLATIKLIIRNILDRK
jgi:hypothetical protein